MAITYDQIVSINVTSAVNEIFISNIPQTYTDLVLVSNLISGNGERSPQVRFNSDTGSVYSMTEIYYTNTTATTGITVSPNFYPIGYYVVPGTVPGFTSVAHIMSYSNTNIFKNILSRTSSSVGLTIGTDIQVGLWQKTDAITSISISFSNVTTVSVGTNLNLYGIKAA